jgi:CheY-like chemotaxis protein
MARPRVLVIDDEWDVRDTIADALSFAGYEVQTASSGHAGLELLGRNPFDLVLCDMRMPEMDGKQFYETVQRDHPRVLKRLVFITAQAQSFEYGAFLREAGIPVLEKPITLRQLREIAIRMVGEAATSGRRRII